mgnify:CR=1 FL=1
MTFISFSIQFYSTLNFMIILLDFGQVNHYYSFYDCVLLMDDAGINIC